jgi:hypothetical protein
VATPWRLSCAAMGSDFASLRVLQRIEPSGGAPRGVARIRLRVWSVRTRGFNPRWWPRPSTRSARNRRLPCRSRQRTRPGGGLTWHTTHRQSTTRCPTRGREVGGWALSGSCHAFERVGSSVVKVNSCAVACAIVQFTSDSYNQLGSEI